MIDLETPTDTWTTPGGYRAIFGYRYHTNDWNVLSSVLRPGNEYDLPSGLTGWAIDVGAHIGAVSVALAYDNPGLTVLAIEPLPENVEMIRRHAELNGLADRIKVVEGAAGEEPRVFYGGSGDSAEHHGFVGNNEWSVASPDHQSVVAETWSLSGLMRWAQTDRIAFLKIDCEGCEWSFLDDPAIGKVERIAGEWHPPGSFEGLVGMLPTHRVARVGDHGFRAVLR